MPARGVRAILAETAARVGSSRGWPRAAIAAGAGLASVLALAPFFIPPVLLVTIPLLVWLIADGGEAPAPRPNVIRAFKDGWWFGFGYFSAGLFWVGEAFLVEAEIFGWLLPFAVTLLPAGLALFYGAATAVARAVWRPGMAGLLILAVSLACAEWLRGHIFTGFPWNVLGYALTSPDILMQSAGLVGIYGLTLWTVLLFGMPAVLVPASGPGTRILVPVILTLVPVLAAIAYGGARLADAPLPDGPLVRIVQPSVPQREKWMPEKQREIFATHLGLSRTEGAQPALIVWPEAAMPFRPLEHPEALTAIGDALPDGTALIAGALRVETVAGRSDRRAFNSLMAFDSQGAVTVIYDKTHLVPFGEYLPFQSVLESIGLQQLTKMRGGFTAGPEPRPVLRVPGLPPIIGLICYEAIFPAAVVQGSERPGLLVNLTNDGWFGNTTGPRQHLHQARVRAVEEGVPLIRVANNGISAMIDAAGQVQAKLALNQRAAIDVRLPAAMDPPAYALGRDWIFAGNAIVFLLIALLLGRRPRAAGAFE